MDELELSTYRLGMESKVRPASIGTLAKGEMKRIDVDMLDRILNELNRLAKERELGKVYTIEDVIEYIPE